MNLAMIFALLLHSGVCAQSEFHGPDGRTLLIMVCPRMEQPDTAAPGTPGPDQSPEAPPATPETPDAPPAPPASPT